MTNRGGISFGEEEIPALVLSVTPVGETGARVHVMTEEHGLVHGMVFGARSRAGRAVWQPGTIIKARFQVSGPASMPRVSGELLYSCAFRLLEQPLALSVMQAVCAILDTALPEYEPSSLLFIKTLEILTALGSDPVQAEQTALAHYVRWELVVLTELGFGLDLSRCAVTGAVTGLSCVSPRTGCAVTEEGAGEWKNKLLPLPSFLLHEEETGSHAEWYDGLRLTGYFLARHVYGQRHVFMPAVRERLSARLKKESEHNINIDSTH